MSWYVRSRDPNRPLLTDRYEHFLTNVAEIREMIRVLRAVYADTRHELLLGMIERFERYERQEIQLEEMWRKSEINEVLDHPSDYPSCVVIWMKYYRNKEMEL